MISSCLFNVYGWCGVRGKCYGAWERAGTAAW